MDFLNKLMPPARWRIVCVALMVVGIVLCLMSYTNDSPEIASAIIVDLGVCVCGTAAFWRCPRCRRLLPLRNMMYLKQCPDCRADVRGF